LQDLAGIRQGITGITVKGYFGKKYQKWSRATNVTTVPLVNDSLTDEVLGLRDFETLRRSIVKIETLVAELKIAINFRRVIRIFPIIFCLHDDISNAKLCFI
jgi:hypothetical protein